MKVTLAGYNVPKDVLDRAVSHNENNEALTPEVLCAAYARISRDPRDIGEIRKDAIQDVEAARKSNKAIVFDMGHATISEHAVFNFDIVGISRLAVEEIESHRLCSFTEKSQRYITLDEDYTIPEELDEDDVVQFKQFVEGQTVLYDRVRKDIEAALIEKADNKSQIKAAPYVAKEDARYVLPMAYNAQLGMTLNARNLELMIKRCLAHPLIELQQLGSKLYNAVKDVTPSLIRYIEPNKYTSLGRQLENKSNLRRLSANGLKLKAKNFRVVSKPVSGVEELDWPSPYNADTKLLEAVLYEHLDHSGIHTTGKYILRDVLVDTLYKDLDSYDTLPRVFEHLNYTFDVLVSATCFAQLKRHRLMTITPQGYSNKHRMIYPMSFYDNLNDYVITTLSTNAFAVGKFQNSIKEKYGQEVFEYCVRNGQQRRVLITMNLRQIYHFSRMRQDKHAQWEIRKLANRIVDFVKKDSPIGGLMLCGKDKFKETYDNVFGEGSYDTHRMAEENGDV